MLVDVACEQEGGVVELARGVVKRTLARPQNAIVLFMLILSGVMHMRLGMQTIIEDYVHSDGYKVLALLLNTFFTAVVGLSCAYAVLKLSFGA